MSLENDERFSHISTDPRFHLASKQKRKVKIDERFHGLFTEPKFAVKSLDTRGRPSLLKKKTDNLSIYYDQDTENKVEGVPCEADILSSDEAGGDSDESSTDSEKDFEISWKEFDGDAPRSDEITCRLAVCNMDWDRIKASDIFVLLHSFKPANGTIESVGIYPSEFGLKRLEKEDEDGPFELLKENVKNFPDSQSSLRVYQLNRLKYYYAVVQCDSTETANYIYQQCDNLEYESSSVSLDLRFIPDDMSFENPVSVVDSLPDLSSYEPSVFLTTVLNQTKVELTWDETDAARSKMLVSHTLNKNVPDDDLDRFVASSSSENEEQSTSMICDYIFPTLNSHKEKSSSQAHSKLCSKNKKADQINKYRALLTELKEKDSKINDDPYMDISFGPVDEEKLNKANTNDDFFFPKKVNSDDEDVKKSNKSNKKKRLKKKIKRKSDDDDGTLNLLISEEPSVDSIKNTAHDFKFDFNDKRFAAIYTSPEFSLDPTSSEFKKSQVAHDILKRKVDMYVDEKNKKTKEVLKKQSSNLRRTSDTDGLSSDIDVLITRAKTKTKTRKRSNVSSPRDI